MVALAQLVELWIVIPKVTGSIPVRHPSFSSPSNAVDGAGCHTRRLQARRLPGTQLNVGLPERSKGAVCNTVVRQFESGIPLSY